MTLSADPVRSPEELQAAWKAAHLKPLWEIAESHTVRTTGSGAHVWRWRELEPLIFEALKVASPQVAERRVLSMIDPGASGREFHTTKNLNAALQILNPGESARPHRHTMNALRFVLKGSGATTTVDGKACPMAEGDLVLTPGWTWHEHKHGGTEPIVWLDVLDVALHLYLATDRFEPGPVHDPAPQLDETAFAAPNVVPDGIASNGYSPIFRYPLADAVAALKHAPPGRDGARRVRYVNPLTGGAVMSLLDCYLIELDPHQDRSVSHHGERRVRGRLRDGDDDGRRGHLRLGTRDVIALPNGQWTKHKAGAEPARLFVTTDREVYRKLDLLKEEFKG